MKKRQKFYQLDNAAKIFPAVSNANRSYMFRISVILKEEVQYAYLVNALSITTKLFPNFNVRLKKGFFWHYFEENQNQPKVIHESIFINEYLIPALNNDFLFRTLYYKNRISVEFFHVLTDGIGAKEFINALVYQYFKLLEYKLDENVDFTTEENDYHYNQVKDQFLELQNNHPIKKEDDPKAYHPKGVLFRRGYLGVIHGYFKVDQLKEVAKSFNATITEFFAAAIIYATINSIDKKNYKKLFRLIVPVNLRSFFPSVSLRNFASFIRINYDLNETSRTFEEILKIVKQQSDVELNKEKLLQKTLANVKYEKNPINRIMPLYIKMIAMKAVYGLLGEAKNSFALSNIGIIDLPESMKKHISHYQFIIGASNHVVKSASIISFNNTLTFTFVSRIVNREVETNFFKLVNSLRLDSLVESNNWEVV